MTQVTNFSTIRKGEGIDTTKNKLSLRDIQKNILDFYHLQNGALLGQENLNAFHFPDFPSSLHTHRSDPTEHPRAGAKTSSKRGKLAHLEAQLLRLQNYRSRQSTGNNSNFILYLKAGYRQQDTGERMQYGVHESSTGLGRMSRV